MSIRRGYLHPRHHQKPIHRQAILALQSFFPQILVHLTGIVIRDRDPTETTRFGTSDQLLRRVRRISRIEGMGVKIEAMAHGR